MAIAERLYALERFDNHELVSELVILKLGDIDFDIANMEQLYQVTALDYIIEDVNRFRFQADVRSRPAVQHDNGRARPRYRVQRAHVVRPRVAE